MRFAVHGLSMLVSGDGTQFICPPIGDKQTEMESLIGSAEQSSGAHMNKLELLRTFNRVSELSTPPAGESHGSPSSTAPNTCRRWCVGRHAPVAAPRAKCRRRKTDCAVRKQQGSGFRRTWTRLKGCSASAPAGRAHPCRHAEHIFCRDVRHAAAA